MRVLVTGAGGYLGQGVVKELLDGGVNVIATDINCSYVDERAERKEADIFNLDNPFEYFGKPDVVLHMAWRNGFVHNDDSHIEDFPKHYTLLKKFIEAGIKRVAVMGTMHEVGFFEGCIDENTPTHPESLYGISKDALRNVVEMLCKKENIVFQWLRGYYIVGNTERGNSIFSKITAAEKEGKKKFPFTTGCNQYDFINYEDFCKQVSATVRQDEINGVINICSGYPVRLSERVESFIMDNNFNIKLDYGKYPDRPYDSKAVWGNNHKIKQIMENE